MKNLHPDHICYNQTRRFQSYENSTYYRCFPRNRRSHRLSVNKRIRLCCHYEPEYRRKIKYRCESDSHHNQLRMHSIYRGCIRLCICRRMCPVTCCIRTSCRYTRQQRRHLARRAFSGHDTGGIRPHPAHQCDIRLQHLPRCHPRYGPQPAGTHPEYLFRLGTRRCLL